MKCNPDHGQHSDIIIMWKVFIMMNANDGENVLLAI